MNVKIKKFDVWYHVAKAGERQFDDKVFDAPLSNTHKYVATIEFPVDSDEDRDHRDIAFDIMNGFGRMENPLATEAGQFRLGTLGVYHTSMSVNDALFDHDTGEIWIVAGYGWTEKK